MYYVMSYNDGYIVACPARPWGRIVHGKKEDAGVEAELANSLLAQGFRATVRNGFSVFAKNLLEIRAPLGNAEDGWIRVVEYRPFTGEPDVERIAVECPSRRAVMHRIHEAARFKLDERELAVEYALEMAARGEYAAGEPYTPGELYRIECAEGNPAAALNLCCRISWNRLN